MDSFSAVSVFQTALGDDIGEVDGDARRELFQEADGAYITHQPSGLTQHASFEFDDEVEEKEMSPKLLIFPKP